MSVGDASTLGLPKAPFRTSQKQQDDVAMLGPAAMRSAYEEATLRVSSMTGEAVGRAMEIYYTASGKENTGKIYQYIYYLFTCYVYSHNVLCK